MGPLSPEHGVFPFPGAVVTQTPSWALPTRSVECMIPNADVKHGADRAPRCDSVAEEIMKPNEFTDLRVISADTAYQAKADLSDGSQTSRGTLQPGRCVWIQHSAASANVQALVPAYVEGIGIISLDLRSVFPVGSPLSVHPQVSPIAQPVGLVGEIGGALPDCREVTPVLQQSGSVRSLNATFTDGYLSHDQNSGIFVQFESNQVEGLRSLSVSERVSFDVVEDAAEGDQQGHAKNIQRIAGDLEAYQDQGGLYS